MAINVYGWRKPTLELELVEGGSLLANTKYYVCGVMKYTPVTYTSVGSPLSDIYEITTTSTAKSIKITQKTYRDITAFASAGAGITTVTCPLHCLKSTDVIKIASGSYAGTWTITKVDANTFTIPTSYVDNVATECYTDSITYNMCTDFSTSTTIHCMSYYVYITHPMQGQRWMGGNYWTSRAYQNVNGTTNPTTITAQPTQSFNQFGNCDLTVRHLNSGYFKSVVPYGSILVVLTAEHTLQQIYDAVLAAGYEYNCHYSVDENTFTLVGALVGTTTGKLTATSTNMTFVIGECFVPDNYQDNFNFYGCLISLIPRTSQITHRYNATNSVFYNNQGSNCCYGNLFGTDVTVCGPFSLGGDYALTYKNLVTDLNISARAVANKKYKDLNQSFMLQTSYGQGVFINSELYPIYWVTSFTTDYEPDRYMMENCYLNAVGSFDYHIRFYNYNPANKTTIRYLNINTDSSDNRLKCVNNSLINADIYLYRRAKFYIKNQEGLTIEGADINIIDNAGNTYSGITDSSGYTYIDCVEQLFSKRNADGTASYYATQANFDTFYTDFTITITKSGYQNEIIKLDKLYQTGFYDTVLNVSLNPIEPRITIY